MEILRASGFCFFKQIDEDRQLLENKFTGLLVIYNSKNDTYKVVE